MIPVTSATIRSLSKLDFNTLVGAISSNVDPLDPFASEAGGYVEFVTGRLASSLPVALDDLFTRAVRMRVEQSALQAQPEIPETAADFDLIQSFTAGPYSETRRSPGAASTGLPEVNAWPELNRMLWLLMETSQYPSDVVDAKRDYWLYVLRGMYGPAWGIVEVDWGRGLGEAANDPANFPYGAHNGWPNGMLGGA